MKVRLLALSFAALVLLAAAVPARGAVTIGSNLATAAMFNLNCTVPCTTANLSLIAANQAPNGLTSPIDGTVTSFRVKSGSSGAVSLRVLRPGTGLTFTGVGTSNLSAIAIGITGPIPTALPIKVGDAIGLDNPNDHLVLGGNAGGTQVYWHTPPLADGTPRAGTTEMGIETMVQAVVELDVDCDRLGDETQDPTLGPGCLADVLSGKDKGKRLKLTVNCPLVTQSCDNNTVAVKGKGKGPKLGKATFSIPAGATQTVTTKLSNAAQDLFDEKGKLKAKATLTGGNTTVVDPIKIK